MLGRQVSDSYVVLFLTATISYIYASSNRQVRSRYSLPGTNPMLSRGKDKRLSPDDVVKEILRVIEETFGKEILPAMELCFDDAYKISFKDNSVFNYPDRFAEALLYAFGEGRETMLKLINNSLAEMISFEDLEELSMSSAYGYVYLIDLIKRKIES